MHASAEGYGESKLRCDTVPPFTRHASNLKWHVVGEAETMKGIKIRLRSRYSEVFDRFDSRLVVARSRIFQPRNDQCHTQ